MILDIINNSYLKNFVEPSPLYKEHINGLRTFMFERVYNSPVAKAEEGKAVKMIKFLYEYFLDNVALIPDEIRRKDSAPEQKVVDYISTMSDQYAVRVFEDITVPKGWSIL